MILINTNTLLTLSLPDFFAHFVDSLLSTETTDSTTDESDAQTGGETSGGIHKINFQPSVSRRNANRYALSFHRETVKEMKAQKDAAKKPIQFILRSDLETGDEYFQGYDFPIRPKWSYDMSKEQIDRNENRYFTVKFCWAAAFTIPLYTHIYIFILPADSLCVCVYTVQRTQREFMCEWRGRFEFD